MVDLFNELLDTVLNHDDGITVSHVYYEPALKHLHEMADWVTLDRCLKKRAEERKRLMGEVQHGPV